MLRRLAPPLRAATLVVTGSLICCALPAQATETSEALFEDRTAAAGLAGVRAKRVSFADLDGDGRPDLVLDCSLVLMNRAGRFRTAFPQTLLRPQGTRRAECVQAGDFDGDGRLDLFLGRNIDTRRKNYEDDGLRNEIWLQRTAGEFERKEDAGLGDQRLTTISACVLDFDRDGHLDLFIGNAYVPGAARYVAFPDRLYRGRGDGSFADVTEQAGLLGISEVAKDDSRRPTYGVTHADWNNDGWQDLFVMTYGRQWNRLWRNDGDGTFTDVAAQTTYDGDAERSGKHPPGVGRPTEKPFRANGNTFDAAIADFDNDGDLDCFLAEITHWWAGESSDPSMLLVNQGRAKGWAFARRPALIAREPAVARWNQGDLHAGWLDVDNDGLLDLVVASSDYPDEQILRLWHQRSDHSFEDWTDRLGLRWVNATQISFADFDRDGATDIVVGTSNHRLTKAQRAGRDLNVGLFRNTCAAAAGNRFLSLRLDGQAIGARVTLETAAGVQLREVQGGLGHAGHRDDTECRFGVGKAERVRRLTVVWPDRRATTQTFEGLRTNRFYSLRRGGKPEVLPGGVR